MRQAGRYLPEYIEKRKNAGSFLNLCLTPEMAAEITLQPIKRFGFDAAIIFSDILVVPYALGIKLDFHEGKGPILEPVKNLYDIKNLNLNFKKLEPVFESLKITKKELPKDTALIGFAGAPWTVSTYMIEGGTSKQFDKVKSFVFNQEEEFEKMIDILVEATSEYLCAQAESGAEVLQIFDSWAGILGEREFRKLIIEPTKKIIKNVKKRYPEIPIIGFPKGASFYYEEYIAKTGIDAIGSDYTVPLKKMREWQEKIPVQGNLDPSVLTGSRDKILQDTVMILDGLAHGNLIFNLGHGMLPTTPIKNVELLVEIVKGWKK